MSFKEIPSILRTTYYYRLLIVFTPSSRKLHCLLSASSGDSYQHKPYGHSLNLRPFDA